MTSLFIVPPAMPSDPAVLASEMLNRERCTWLTTCVYLPLKAQKRPEIQGKPKTMSASLLLGLSEV